jgi:hypothetical protein
MNEPMEYAEHYIEEDQSDKFDRKFVASFLKEVSINSMEQNKHILGKTRQ